MTNSKLLKVMDYLINEQEDKARDLLHQIFIEKARSIHEEMLSDEEHEMGGDEGEDLGRDIEAHKDEIESEEHYGDGTMEDVDLDDAVEDLSDEMEDADDADDEEVDVDVDVEDEDEDDMSMGDEEHEEDHEEEAGEERFQDLEQAIEELKAEFESLKDELHAEHGEEEDKVVDESWMDDTDDLDESYGDSGTTPKGTRYKFSSTNDTVTINGRTYRIGSANAYGSVEYEIDRFNIAGNQGGKCEVYVDEDGDILFTGTEDACWNYVIDRLGGSPGSSDLDEEYDDLDEAVELDTVSVDAKKAAEVGTGKFARPDVSKTSPTPKTAHSPVPGAAPVVTGKGAKADGYHLQPAPKSNSMNITNRRKKASDDMSHVSKEGSTKAMLNKDRTEGFGTPNVQSPIGSTGTTPKK